MNNDVLKRVDELIKRELDKMVAKGAMSAADLEACEKAVCILEKIKECEEMDMGEYSNSMRSYRDSYARGRNPMNGQHMSMNNAYGPNPYPSYVNADYGYSGHSIKDRMIDSLERMMDTAQTDYERQTVMEEIKKLREG